MDVFDEDLLAFWRILNKNNVRYIMVGGIATHFHGCSGNHNDDVDIWLNDTIINRQRLREAFIELGYGDYENLEMAQFIAGKTNFRVDCGLELDIMTEMKGVDLSFSECYELISKADIEGVVVPFLHINHLIDNKKAVNRPKDQIDVENLEKIKQIRKGE